MKDIENKSEQDVQDVFWVLVDELLHSLATEECHQHHQDTLDAFCIGHAMKCQPRTETPKHEVYKQNKGATVNDIDQAIRKSIGRKNGGINKYTRLGIGRPACEHRSRSTSPAILSDDHRYNAETRSRLCEETLQTDNDGNDNQPSEFQIKVMFKRKGENAPSNEGLWRKAIENITLQRQDAENEAESGDSDDMIKQVESGDSNDKMVAQIEEKTHQHEAAVRDLQKQLTEPKAILGEPMDLGESVSHGESESCCELCNLTRAVSDKGLKGKANSRLKLRGKGKENGSKRQGKFRKAKGPRETKSESDPPTKTDTRNNGSRLPLIDNPSQIDFFTKPNTGGHGSCDDTLEHLKDCSEGTDPRVDAINTKFDKSKKQYNDAMKERVRCCSRLQKMNNEIANHNLNPRIILRPETMRKYFNLKSEYLKICCLESSLQNQIAKLQGEIFAIKNKRFKKPTASIHTITLDSTTTNLASEFDIPFVNKGAIFPSLQPPRQLIFPHQKDYVKYNWQTRITYPMKPEWEDGKSQEQDRVEFYCMLTSVFAARKPRRLGLCYQDEDKQTPYLSVYNLTPTMQPYPIKRIPLKKPVPINALYRYPCTCIESLE